MDETSAETQSEANPPFDRVAFKAKWIAALRSGEYKQGRHYLRGEDDQFCCLGVAADLVGVEWEKRPSGVWLADDHVSTLGDLLCNKLGLDPIGYLRSLGNSLASLNDGGKSFPEIAAVIEANWHPTND